MSQPGTRAPLLAVDAPSLLYRSFFALPASITAPDGQPVNALLGTANLILFVVERRRPRAVVLCFGAEAADYRVALYPRYHADRPPMPAELAGQWTKAHTFFEALGWIVLEHPELEADDLLGSLARVETAAGGQALLLTGDRDMFQCVDEHVRVLFPGGGNARGRAQGPEEIDAAAVRERYGIDPGQVPDFIALRGDPSDGLPGARGIGAKTAAELLRVHGSLEGAIDNAQAERPRVAQALRESAEELRTFRRIATLEPVELACPADQPTEFSAGARAAAEMGMDRLAARLDRLAAEAARRGGSGSPTTTRPAQPPTE